MYMYMYISRGSVAKCTLFSYMYVDMYMYTYNTIPTCTYTCASTIYNMYIYCMYNMYCMYIYCMYNMYCMYMYCMYNMYMCIYNLQYVHVLHVQYVHVHTQCVHVHVHAHSGGMTDEGEGQEEESEFRCGGSKGSVCGTVFPQTDYSISVLTVMLLWRTVQG